MFDIGSFRQQRRRDWQAAVADPATQNLIERLSTGSNPDQFVVNLRELQSRCVAYIRVFDPFREGVVVEAAKRLVTWAEGGGLASGQWLGYMWEDPEIVARPDCRYDVGLEVSEVVSEGEVGRLEFPRMLVAEVEVCGGIDLEQRALDWLFGTWLPSSGYVPTAQPCFEAWIGRPFAQGYEHFELLVQLPVERA